MKRPSGSRPNLQNVVKHTELGTSIKKAFAEQWTAEQWTVVKFPGRLRWAVLDHEDGLLDVTLLPSGQWNFQSSAGVYSPAELEQVKKLCRETV